MIALRGMTKAFPGVLAADHIDLDIFRAEIHALLGENGAGKSTLVKLLFGFYRADAGEILLDEKPLPMQSPVAHPLIPAPSHPKRGNQQ